MTSPSSTTGRRWWWIAAAIVVLVAAGVLFAVNRGDGKPSAGDTTPPLAASAGPRPSRSEPACLPTVIEAGFAVVGQSVRYGVVARNDCPEAVINAAVKIRVVDPSGNPVAGTDEQLPDLVVLLPGQQLAGAGRFYLDKPGKVGKVEAAFAAATPAPTTAFAAWPRQVSVTGVTAGAPDSHGRSTVTGRITTDPANTALCSPTASLILRDSNGKIIYGMTGQIRDDQVSFELAVPKATDRSTISVAIALGQPALTLDSVPTAACTA
ncbi:hypothetical protein Acy02nite_46970 [Actinoplanes cyaneus]|uniref:Uncharacterized protein n=1 Tax=Actinoplanes cyaneus TaxID=52696 RepID=A0A919MD58_9ACTN|nr:hypothetical protein [Actinoplanes cyaneus]MCW2138847.1 hypothetical protein [Actinoplanes cyaneus]GID66816.1 hypothetical protein Acy02nite_46970 [Actinoplanes cyaneus]